MKSRSKKDYQGWDLLILCMSLPFEFLMELSSSGLSGCLLQITPLAYAPSTWTLSPSASYHPRLPYQYPVFTTGPLILTTFSHTPLSLWTSYRGQIFPKFGTT